MKQLLAFLYIAFGYITDLFLVSTVETNFTESETSFHIDWSIASAIVVKGLVVEGRVRLPIKPWPRPNNRLTPCFCDLTEGVCDLNCCCDKECSAGLKSSLRCWSPDSKPRFNRDCERPIKERSDDLFSVLCVQRVTSPFLGDFYRHYEQLPATSTEFEDFKTAILQTKVSQTSLSGELPNSYASISFNTRLLNSGAYRFGSPIMTVGTAGQTGYLSLPQQLLNNVCTWNSPIRFLENSQSHCVRKLDRTSCTTEPSFDARSFLVAARAVVADGSNNTTSFYDRVVRDLNSGASAWVTTTFLCMNEFNQSKSFIERNTSFWFRSSQSERAHAVPKPCGTNGVQNDPRSNQENSIPPTPSLTTTLTAACLNVVRRVLYRMYWNSSELVAINVEVVLSNSVPLSSRDDSSILIGQDFEVEFQHTSNRVTSNITSSTRSRDGIKQANSFPRSGNPGYEPGKPVITATIEKLTTANTVANQKIDATSLGSNLSYWINDASSLCAFSSFAQVKFLENVDSGCYLQLRRIEIQTCTGLRDKLFSGLGDLYRATHISRFGKVESDDLSNFVEILRSTEENPFSSNYTTRLSTGLNTTVQPTNLFRFTIGSGSTPGDPNGSTSLPTEAADNPNIPGSTVSGRHFRSIDSRPSMVPFSCGALPYHVTLEILYSETADDVFEVTGAYIYYNLTTWRFVSSSATQRFAVSTSVRFFKRPPRLERQTKRYYTKETRFHCPSELTCWNGLFYPFQYHPGVHSYSFTYALSFGLAFLLIIVSIAAILWFPRK